MKNVQVIDGALNCTYDIFQVSDAGYRMIFGPGEDVAFIDEVVKKNRSRRAKLKVVFESMWKRRLAKRDARGIHGLLFYELPEKKAYYPTRRDEDARNPAGPARANRDRGRGAANPLSRGRVAVIGGLVFHT